ncbi:DNA polymerase [Paenibacillus sp. P22]|uniref:DNA polymerase n=1 Tax=Paenibacillus sp. P22 TaxID=483908 RepID=UPI00038FA07B|nr:DNA polymerase [Paenibacillus sp. P22]CDN42039.1 DNA polymerase I-like protein-3'-5' exonuclease and polymerase domains [Paenibacillus sp. P22]
MTDKVRLALRVRTEPEASERVAEAAKRKGAATPETAAQAFERIGAMSMTDKERAQFNAAYQAFTNGETGSPRSDGGKWTKGDVLAAGARILRQKAEGEREGRITAVLASKPPNYRILTDDSELPAFVDRLRLECQRQMTEWPDKFRILGVDTMTAGDFEGTGVDTYIDLSIGFSVWLPLLDEGYYLPYGHVDMRGEAGFEFLTERSAFKATDPQLTRSKVLAAISPYLSRPNHGKTFHMGSARYDLFVAIKDGYEIGGCVWDTLDAMNTLNEHEEAYGLKPLVAKYGRWFGVPGPVYTFEDMFGNRSPAPFSVELVGIYAIKDVYYGWRLFEWQYEQMANAPSADGKGRLLECYALIDSKLPETDVFMAGCGFEIDLDGLAALEAEFTPKLEEARSAVFESYGIDAEFVRKMDRTIHAKKVADWIEAQRKRSARHAEAVAKVRATIAADEVAGKTKMKRYADAVARLATLEAEVLAPADEEHAPLFTEEFSITNGNHLAYLIYDHLGIRDRTGQFKRGKSRSTAADVLDAYYEEEEALKPLATVAAYEKLLNTYVTKIPKALEADGRLHSEFKAGGTATGRYSSAGYSGRPIDILDEFKTEVDAAPWN